MEHAAVAVAVAKQAPSNETKSRGNGFMKLIEFYVSIMNSNLKQVGGAITTIQMNTKLAERYRKELKEIQDANVSSSQGQLIQLQAETTVLNNNVGSTDRNISEESQLNVKIPLTINTVDSKLAAQQMYFFDRFSDTTIRRG